MSESFLKMRWMPRPAGALAVLLLLVLPAAPASAVVCFLSADPQIQQLQSLVNQDAIKALEAARRQIRSLGESDAPRRAALYGVMAHAYSILELDRDARAAATTGLSLAPRGDDLVHLDLLTSLANNIYDADGITEAVGNIESARRGVERGSLADICLTITLGNLQHRQDRDDLAVVTLTNVYAAAAKRKMDEQRLLAAGKLANVLAGLGDLQQALTMNQQLIDWDTAHQAWLRLSVSRFLRGQIYKVMHDYEAAAREFAEARRLSATLDDDQGIAFADLRLCHTQIELKKWEPARQQCLNALRIFTASQSTDMIKEARGLLAQVDLNQGRPREALTALNTALDQDGADMSPRRVAMLYQARAQANAALGRFETAYADLQHYMRRYVEVNDAERIQQTAAMRARFETDREIERNALLQRELEISRERGQRQKELLRWTIIGIAAGAIAIVLLTYILISTLRHRKQLSCLASQDALTGVFNRRRVTELSTQALIDAASRQETLTVAIIDMDHFKLINDRCGHAAGDFVLKEFARLCRESIRSTDIFGRWGGEEFLLVLPRTTLDTAAVILERLRLAALTIRLPTSSDDLRVSLSAGLASNDAETTSLDDIVAQADAALYEAKHRGRDTVHIADQSYNRAATGVREALRLGTCVSSSARIAAHC